MSSPEQELPVKWVKPEFEIIELSSEVTCYRYHR
jgi:coenzyme PQQ precursor peptide PqqA